MARRVSESQFAGLVVLMCITVRLGMIGRTEASP
jgi:hypothetical protein